MHYKNVCIWAGDLINFFRIHSYVMSFVFFTSEHIQNVGEVPTDTNYNYSLQQVLV